MFTINLHFPLSFSCVFFIELHDEEIIEESARSPLPRQPSAKSVKSVSLPIEEEEGDTWPEGGAEDAEEVHSSHYVRYEFKIYKYISKSDPNLDIRYFTKIAKLKPENEVTFLISLCS